MESVGRRKEDSPVGIVGRLVDEERGQILFEELDHVRLQP